MSSQNLSKIFRPNSVAVVGASAKAESVGRTVLENLQKAKFTGSIYPVNPKYESLLGLPAFGSIHELPSCPDLVVIATPAAGVPAIVGECGERGVLGLVIVSAGFQEVGDAGREIEAELESQLARFPGMRGSARIVWVCSCREAI